VNTGRSETGVGVSIMAVPSTMVDHGDRPVGRQIWIVGRGNNLPTTLDIVGGEDT
jgi:hypothetical protein